jgi:hypothetical protein
MEVDDTSPEARTSMLMLAIHAAGGGHDLGGFVAVEVDDKLPRGHQATCRNCGMPAFVSSSGEQYSLLDDVCPGGR